MVALKTVQLVIHYDGSRFAGWQRQKSERTVQGVLETTLETLCNSPIPVLGAGRTDAGVHARGQAAGVRVPEKWAPDELRRALNALLPKDIWIAKTHLMQDDFHARYSATARRYGYYIGTDEAAASPFRRQYEYLYRNSLDREKLNAAASAIIGDHCFRAFAVKGTAPEGDDHRCVVTTAQWEEWNNRPDNSGGFIFRIQANRFLHHMVRFLVGTMLDIASGKKDLKLISELLLATENSGVSSPAPAHALFLEEVIYPGELYAA